MKKNFITRLMVLLLMGIAFSILFTTNSVQATSQEQTNSSVNDILASEEKIMKYDARTNQTTQVDMEELKQVIALQNTNGLNSNSISPYDPYAKLNLTYKTMTPFSTKSADIVNNTYNFPNRVTCRIKSKDKDNISNFGTCAIVGPRVGLTAAHCVFDSEDGNAVLKNWTIYPGCNGYNTSTGDLNYYGIACGWDTVYYSNVWMQTHSDQYDWAICVLQSDLGNQLGWFGTYSYATNAELNGMDVKLYGYPQGKENGYTEEAVFQYTTGEKITEVGSRYFRYSASVCNGFSGGPITRTSDNYIVGIHFGKVWDKPTGARITGEMVDIIRSIS